MPAIDRVIPVLTYRDIAAAHDFLVGAFGFTPGGVERNPDGEPFHGEVRAGAAEIWLHRFTAEHQLASPVAVDVANSALKKARPDDCRRMALALEGVVAPHPILAGYSTT